MDYATLYKLLCLTQRKTYAHIVYSPMHVLQVPSSYAIVPACKQQLLWLTACDPLSEQFEVVWHVICAFPAEKSTVIIM